MATRPPIADGGRAVLVLIGIGLFAAFCAIVAAMLGHTAQLAYADWQALWASLHP
jgi:hypothetical protein